jgi:hypothetical protein
MKMLVRVLDAGVEALLAAMMVAAPSVTML